MAAKRKQKLKKAKRIGKKMEAGYSTRIALLHIPKTGGTSLAQLGRELVGKGYEFPLVLGHIWNHQRRKQHFPDLKLVFLLRDPLERAISGYVSRLRQGRPAHPSMWSPQEAAVFAMMPSAKHLLDAMLSDDDFAVSAVAFAQQEISHLRWNYEFYFQSPDCVREHQSDFLAIGEMERFDEFVDALAKLSGAPLETVRSLYHRQHSAKVKTSSLLDEYSPGDLERLRASLGNEYAIYHELRKIAREQADPAN